MAFSGERWTLANLLPVFFVIWIISSIWGVYVFLHLVPLASRDWQMFTIEAGISQTLTLLLLTCFYRAIFTDPGSVPDTLEWKEVSQKPQLKGIESGAVHESKLSGERRFCKWCDMYKPDRCHHCRICKSCILRMDHHCPWIANCVGFKNHKYFFLLVWYALLNCAFIIMTMSGSLALALTEYTPSMSRFLLVFGLTLAAIMGVLLKVFFSLHFWLMLKAATTIELCEKQAKREFSGKPAQSYDDGIYNNIAAVLGPVPWLWLLPVMPPPGDGTRFHLKGDKDVVWHNTETTPLMKDCDDDPGRPEDTDG